MAKIIRNRIKRVLVVYPIALALLLLTLSSIAVESIATEAIAELNSDSAPLQLEIIPVKKTQKSPLKALKRSSDAAQMGTENCIECHDKAPQYLDPAFFQTASASSGDSLSPFEKNHCETCHQPRNLSSWRIGAHQTNGVACFNCHMIHGEQDPMTASSSQIEPCKRCHQKQRFVHNEVACVACHQIHAEKDPITIKSAQIDRCGGCHQQQRLAQNRPTHHPIQTGQMGCDDCHKPHDADGDKLLAADDTNETCYRCHGEKRGPFLWDHAPSTENCMFCHLPHGSNQPAMLIQRAPLLCQMCHNPIGHTALHVNDAYDADALRIGSPPTFLLGRSCLNCHSQIHGSNHPSGSKLQR